MKIYHREFENDSALAREADRLAALANTLGGVANPSYSHGHGPAILVAALPDEADGAEFGQDVTEQFPAARLLAFEDAPEDEEDEDDSWEDEDGVEEADDE